MSITNHSQPPLVGLTEQASAHLSGEVCAQHRGLLDELADLEVLAQEQEREGGVSISTEERIWAIEDRLNR